MLSRKTVKTESAENPLNPLQNGTYTTNMSIILEIKDILTTDYQFNSNDEFKKFYDASFKIAAQLEKVKHASSKYKAVFISESSFFTRLVASSCLRDYYIHLIMLQKTKNG
uniref:Rep_3 domain-containing protein n=1 Tax=Rhabditophanes sp. KR3021 TaxID=114890 RepID=A0AC35U0B3_9BILA